MTMIDHIHEDLTDARQEYTRLVQLQEWHVANDIPDDEDIVGLVRIAGNRLDELEEELEEEIPTPAMTLPNTHRIHLIRHNTTVREIAVHIPAPHDDKSLERFLAQQKRKYGFRYALLRPIKKAREKWSDDQP